MWNLAYSFHLCFSYSSFLSAQKGKAIPLNTQEIPHKVKIRHEATVQGNSFVFNPNVSGLKLSWNLAGQVSIKHPPLESHLYL